MDPLKGEAVVYGKIFAHGAGVPFEQKMIEKIGAHAWREIVAEAHEWNADLIVIGTHGAAE